MSIPTLRQSQSGTYYVHWSDGRRSKRESTRTKELAKAKAYLAHFLMTDSRPQPDAALHLEVGHLWEQYFERYVRKATMSAETYEFSWRNLSVFFGGLHVADVTDEAVERYIERRKKGKIGRPANSPSTVRRELSMLRSCLNWAAHPKRKLILPAELPHFDIPAGAPPRDRWLRTEEIQRLMHHVASTRRGEELSPVEIFLWLALETAARCEAICELTWDRVDFETGVIHLNRPGRKITKKRRSSPPISAALRPVLERAFRERSGDLVVGYKAHSMWNIVSSAARGAQLVGISPHVLRHTAATHMARRGVPLWQIAGVLGNSVAMVETVYAKHSPDGLQRAVDSISAGFLEPVE